MKNFVTVGDITHPIYISTGAAKETRCADDIVLNFVSNGIQNIELASGATLKDLKNLHRFRGVNYLVHNYFPRPADDIVINLAEPNNVSLDFVKNSIDLSVSLNSNIYSAHAGFVSKLRPSDLGNHQAQRLIEEPDYLKYEYCENIFSQNVNKILEYSGSKGVEFAIENNGISPLSVNASSDIPRALMVSLEDVIRLSKKINKLNILFDVAHAKISGRAFNFSCSDFLLGCGGYIREFHLSDNDGIIDTNNEIKYDSWFFDEIKFVLKRAPCSIPIVLEVYNIEIDQIYQQSDLVCRILEGQYVS